MTEPLLSVIIPTYNRATLLARAIRSVLNQSLPADELLVVDDGSSDHTTQVLAQLQQEEQEVIQGESLPHNVHHRPRFLVIRQQNQGAAVARNRGLACAKGRLIAFLDSDDWWQRDKLAKQSAVLLAQPNCLISHTGERWFREGKQINQKKKFAPPQGNIFAASLDTCVVGISTVMARRELFARYGLFDERLPCCEDYEFWLRVGRVEPFLLLPEALTLKEGGRADQLSSIHRVGMDRLRIQALQAVLDRGGLSAEQWQQASVMLAEKCSRYGRGCLKHGRPEEGAYYLTLAASCQARLLQTPLWSPAQ